MFEWLSDHRATIALVVIIGLAISFVVSIHIGIKQTRLRAKDQVFGDPDRTKGGWFWALCGISALLLVWFYYSWGIARAVFPTAANELCQVAKVEEAMSPITAALPVGSRYMKSTTLVVRNGAQINQLDESFPQNIFSPDEEIDVKKALSQIRSLMALLSNPNFTAPAARLALADVEGRLYKISERLAEDYTHLVPSEEALGQPKWGTSEVEIPLLPVTARGVLLDSATSDIQAISKSFLNIRNLPPEAVKLIASTKTLIDSLKKPDGNLALNETDLSDRGAYLKAVDRIFKRIDDGTIFPAIALDGVHQASMTMFESVENAKGGLTVVESLFSLARV